MIDNLFAPVAKVIGARRPTWTFIVEDSLVRILTQQFAVDWDIIDEIIDAGDFKIQDVILHRELGVVISIRSIAGK